MSNETYANIPGSQLTQREAVVEFLSRGSHGDDLPVGICWEGSAGEVIYKRFEELTEAQQRMISKRFNG